MNIGIVLNVCPVFFHIDNDNEFIGVISESWMYINIYFSFEGLERKYSYRFKLTASQTQTYYLTLILIQFIIVNLHKTRISVIII